MNKVLILGVTDPGHSRTVQLIRVLANSGLEPRVVEWKTKSTIGFETFDKHKPKLLFAIWDLLTNTIRFANEILKTDRHDVIFLSHPSQLNLMLVGPLSKILLRKLVVDFYVSLHDTLVLDRGLVSKNGALAKLLSVFDALTIKFSDHLIFDTSTNRQRFCEGRAKNLKKSTVLYPEPPSTFRTANKEVKKTRDVIFVGKFSPLMGVEIIAKAISSGRLDKYTFTIVGTGQTIDEVRPLKSIQNVNYFNFIPYSQLPEVISSHRVSLGIFGTSEKAGSVFPNKVMESLYLGVPCITRSGEIESNFDAIGCIFIPPGDSDALADQIAEVLENPELLASLEEEARAFRVQQSMSQHKLSFLLQRF